MTPLHRRPAEEDAADAGRAKPVPGRPPSGVASPRRHRRCVEAKDHKTMEERTCVLLVCVLAA
jgi:hypothetical protein